MSKRTKWLLSIGVIAALVMGFQIAAFAAHPEATLTGSNFEIDVDANLKVDDTGNDDWANVAENRQLDKVNGTGDNSYAGGVKEDTTCPAETTDSIPPNKSDLLSYSVYREPGTGGHPGFLNLAWSRVNDPSGTTLMDFEFNQSSTKCANGPNVVRTTGDLLIEYAIDQGGSRADITVRTWDGTKWGPTTDLDVPSATCGGQPCAAGTINSSPIPAAASDGLISTGQMAPRTFGEAQIDLRLIFQANKCTSIGSSMLKSRSSDSFTSQLKDFVSPVPLNITNCGTVKITKQTDPDEDPNTTSFDYTKAFNTDPTSANTFQLKDDETKTFNNVLFGSGYTVTEDALPTGWDFDNVDCSASTGVTPSITNRTVTFAIDNASDVLDCTYTNKARGTIVVEKITDDGEGAFDFTSGTLTPASFTLTTTEPGNAGKDSRTFSDLIPGTYDVAETVPAGWNLASSSCDDGSDPGSIGLSAGETVTCTFHDARERGTIIVEKITDDGEGAFDFTSNTLTPSPFTLTTTEPGNAGKDSETFSNLLSSDLVGTYDVAETVPAGWNLVSSSCDDGSDPGSIDLEDGETVTCTFHDAQERGSILVSKVDGGGNPLAGAEFALDGDGDPETTDDQTPIPAVEGQDGLFCVDGLLFGDYNVVETVTPSGYTPEDPVQEFTVNSESTCAGRTGETPDEPDLEFVNIRNPGAILITKNAKDVNAESGSSPLAGVSFTVTGPGLPPEGVITEPTNADGQTCLGGLTVGETYTVTESDVPTGFLVDDTVTQAVEITDDAECGSGNEDTAGPFNNDPLSEIEVQFRSLAQNANGEDRTAATIDCSGANGALEADPQPDGTPNDFDDSTEKFTNLKEGTYNCTVVIDP